MKKQLILSQAAAVIAAALLCATPASAQPAGPAQPRVEPLPDDTAAATDETDEAVPSEASEDGADDDAPSDETDEAPTADEESDPTPEPDDADEDEDDDADYDDALFESGSGSSESAAAGTVTILAAVATVASLAYLLERQNTLDVCAAYETEPMATRGCITTDPIQTQRDVGIGLLVTAGSVLVAAAIAWVVVVVTREETPSAALAGCGFDGTLRCRF